MTVVRRGLVDDEPMRFCLRGENYEVNLPGEHQLHDSALVIELALTRGCAPEDIRAALLSFPGLARWFELRGRTAAGARVYDDYAHHSVEVDAALAAARQAARGGRVLVVFQPHLLSRTQQFQREPLDVLASAEGALVRAAGCRWRWPARGPPIPSRAAGLPEKWG